MKRIIFVSTGRCGTKRIYELLNQYLSTEAVIVHQMIFSRLVNILGTIMVSTNGRFDFSNLYEPITRYYSKNKSTFISTDPLSAMIIPTHIAASQDTCIVHLVRSEQEFAKSMYSLSRKRIPSFIAHNFVPFWQPNIFPCENIFNKNIKIKYASACRVKNRYFEERYSVNPFYIKMEYKDIFKSPRLERIIEDFLGKTISIPESELARRSNEP